MSEAEEIQIETIRAAAVLDGRVVNVILMPRGFEIAGWVLVELPEDSPVEPGWVYVDSEFSPNPIFTEPNLSPLKRWQFKAILRMTGYEDDVTAWLAALNDPESPIYDPVSWAVSSAILFDSDEYRYDHPLTESLRQLMDVSEAELQTLWNHGHALANPAA